METLTKSNQKRAKIAIVTGGSSGIGLGICTALLENSYKVICASLKAPLSTNLHNNPNFLFIKTDVRKDQEVQTLVESLSKISPSLDVLVNCAGVGIFGSIAHTSLPDWNSVLETNLTGSFLCVKYSWEMLKIHGGRIFNIGSICDHIGLAESAAYTASKFGVRGLNQVVNSEGAPFGIRSTLISLGAVYTPIWESRPEFSPKDMLNVEDVSKVVIDILSTRSEVRFDEVKLFPPKGIL